MSLHNALIIFPASLHIVVAPSSVALLLFANRPSFLCFLAVFFISLSALLFASFTISTIHNAPILVSISQISGVILQAELSVSLVFLSLPFKASHVFKSIFGLLYVSTIFALVITAISFGIAATFSPVIPASLSCVLYVVALILTSALLSLRFHNKLFPAVAEIPNPRVSKSFSSLALAHCSGGLSLVLRIAAVYLPQDTLRHAIVLCLSNILQALWTLLAIFCCTANTCRPSVESVIQSPYYGRVSLSHSTPSMAPTSMPVTPSPLQDTFVFPPQHTSVTSLAESKFTNTHRHRPSLSSATNFSQHTKQYSLSLAGTRSESHLMSPEPPSPRRMEDPLGTLTEDPFAANHVQPGRARAATLTEADEGIRMTRLSTWGMLTFPPVPTPENIIHKELESAPEQDVVEHAALAQTLLQRLERGATNAGRGITGSWGKRTRK